MRRSTAASRPGDRPAADAMGHGLRIACGQYSDKGRKPRNQDFHAVATPGEPLLGTKGIVAALADGISSSSVSQEAAEVAVKGFLDDYYATPESWSVKTSAQRVLQASNSWLYAQTRNGPFRYSIERGYVCTFSALVLKSTTAHVFHVGDARVYQLSGGTLEQLTEDHRVWVDRDKSYLARALGMRERVEIDYLARPVEVGDLFLLATDGVYEFWEPGFVREALARHAEDLDAAARAIATHALERGSDDNLTLQILRVESLPRPALAEVQEQLEHLPLPPELRPRTVFEGYRILRRLHDSHRSHVYLAQDLSTGQRVVIKTPSVAMREEPEYLERLLLEEWVARRLDNAHVVKAVPPGRRRGHLYTVFEYIEGQTLAQWMRDHPAPHLETVRGIVEQIARGLYALHRQEMLHQDLRPENVMIDRAGTVKLVDLGSVRVAGVAEMGPQRNLLGTATHAAPEYFLGEPGSVRSDLYSLAVIAYQMLTGRLPYGPRVARARTRAAQLRLVYQSACEVRRDLPPWVDEALRKALHPNPNKRYGEISEFVHDLRHPNPAFAGRQRPPLLERNPLRFWQGLAAVLALLVLVLAATHPFFTR